MTANERKALLDAIDEEIRDQLLLYSDVHGYDYGLVITGRIEGLKWTRKLIEDTASISKGVKC